MTWAEDLQEASCDSIPFPVSARACAGSNDAARIRLPYQAGQGIEPTGRGPRTYKLTLPLFPNVEGYTDLYPGTYERLLELFDDPDRPDFEYVDPVHGAVRVFAAEWDDDSNAERQDGCEMHVVLEEVTLDVAGNRVFSSSASPARAGREAALDADEAVAELGVDDDTLQTSMQTAGAPRTGQDNWSAGQTFQGMFEDFTEAVSTVALAADEAASYVEQVRVRVNAVLTQVDQVRTPEGWRAYESLLRLVDACTTLGEQAVARSIPITEIVTTGRTSAGEIATRLYGDRSRVADVMSLNPHVNPMAIPSGTTLRVQVR